MKRLSGIVLISLLLVSLLAACGGSDSKTTPTATTGAAASSTQPAASPTTEATTGTEAASPTAESKATETMAAGPTETASPVAETRSIKHAMGTTEITGVPQRIVVLEWTYAEDLLAMGIQPAGVADIAGYRKWVNVQPALADDVTDVGTRQEPSLESIAALEPDLIIGVQFRHEPIYKDLTAIAPTLLFDPYPTDPQVSQLDEMRTTMLAIADAVARPEEGQKALDAMDAAFAAAKTKLEAAGKAGAPFALVQAFTSKDAPQMRVFTTTSMASSVMEAIGLKNAWQGEFNQYGYNTVGVEALTTIPDANFFYVVQSDDDVFATTWKDNPVWTSLNFVKEGRTYPLGGDTWLFGGPLSVQLLVDKVVTALAG